MICVPPKGSIVHSGYEQLQLQMKRMAVGDSITVSRMVSDGIGVTAKRCGIKVTRRRNGDYLDVYRIK